MPSTKSRRRILGVHLELILVFAFVWLVLGAYSVMDREISVLGHVLVKTDIDALLEPDPEALPAPVLPSEPPEPGAPVAEPGSAPKAAPSAGPKLPPLDDKPQRIMILGDSMVVNLIPRLADYCLENGHKLFPVVWYASTTIAWGSQGKLGDCLREFDPTYVIIVLGASELGARNMKHRAGSVRMINERLKGRHFFWLGPPNWREDTGFNAMVEKAVGPGRFFFSGDIEFERESDGIHPTKAAGSKWVDLFAEWMRTEAAVRIRMDKPTKKANPPSAKVYPPPYKVPEGYLEEKRKK